MRRFLKRLLFLLSTLGLGALAYALMRAEGERALRPARRERGGEAPGPRPVPGPAERPETAAPRAVAAAEPPRCTAVTHSGVRCAREAQPGSQYCWQHG